MGIVAIRSLLICAAFIVTTHAYGYEKATEGREVVMNKLYPKKKKIQLDLKAGAVLNGSYVDTLLFGGGVTYFFSEAWGFSIEGILASTADRGERQCIENFYNDPDQRIDVECAPDGDAASNIPDGARGNMGPAYVPIRQLKSIFTGNFVWNPIYGKQIILLSGTSYFDLFVNMGGGVALSDYYAQQLEFADGSGDTRGSFPETGTSPNDPGTDPANTDLYGEAGRPEPESQSHLVAHFGAGQRFHFWKRFMITAEIKNLTVLGTPSGFDNFFSIMFGFGMRF